MPVHSSLCTVVLPGRRPLNLSAPNDSRVELVRVAAGLLTASRSLLACTGQTTRVCPLALHLCSSCSLALHTLAAGSRCASAMAAGPSNVGASTSKPPKPKTGGRVDKKQAAHTAHVKAATSNAQELAKHVASQFVAAVLDTRHIVVIERMFQRETPVCVR